MVFMKLCGKIIAVIIAAAAVIALMPDVFAAKKQDQSDFVHTDGRDIIGTDGEKLEIRGMAMGNNAFAGKPMPEYTHHTESSYKKLSEMGFNCVRFYLNYNIFESDSKPYHYKKSGFEWLDKNIAWAKKYNIGIIFNMHCPQGGYQSQGNGMALWTDKKNQDRLAALWKEIARRYANEPTVWGYGLINEPIVPLKGDTEGSFQQYKDLFTRLVKEVRSVSPYQAIFVERLCNVRDTEGKQTSDWEWLIDPENTFFAVDDDNIVYEFHTYDYFHFTHQNAEWAGTGGKTMTYPSEEIVSVEYENGWAGAADTKEVKKEDGWSYFESETISLNNSCNIGMAVIRAVGSTENGGAYFDDITLTEVSPNGKKSVKYYYDCNGNTTGSFSSWSADNTGVLSAAPNEGREGGCLKISGSRKNFSASAERFVLKKGYKYYVSGYAKTDDPDCYPSVTIDLAKARTFDTFDKEYLDKAIKPYAEFSKKHNVPLYVGEFGVISEGFKEGRNGVGWVSDMIDIFRKYGMGFNYHAFHEEAFGLYGNSAEELPAKENKALSEMFKEKLN